ncbi:PREDICTED: CD83 antigen [Dipodomys ordii]|uniref:CD83 antigen n=1 Tax=Dipodomys ordii TaxID=10020 RepID=A0A1S3GCX7_DIPOR|nr:PREDICTED: CD83 antigen [Dipodomys ordii]
MFGDLDVIMPFISAFEEWGDYRKHCLSHHWFEMSCLRMTFSDSETFPNKNLGSKVTTVSWIFHQQACCTVVASSQLTESGEQRLEPPQEGLRASGQHYHQNTSIETSGKGPYSLKIQNTTGCSSGTYRCTLQDLGEQKNLSGTVLLKVTGCPKLPEESTFRKYRAEIVLLFSLVIFYLTLIIFTCKFARLQSIFPDISKPGMEQAFLPVTSPNKHLGPVTLPKIETV